MSTTIGTAPDQVPVNGMLGDMAFQSKSAVTIGTLTSNGTTSTDLPTYSSEFITTSASWTTTTGWTGNNTTGWVHATGNSGTLTYPTAAVIGTKYQISYTVTGFSAGSFTVTFGGQSLASIAATGTFGPTATTTGNLIITPLSTFVGTIVISIKSITAVSSPVISLKDSTNTVRFETRVSSTVNNTFLGLSSGSYNTTGYNNSSVGYIALNANTTGSGNSAIGVQALYNNTTGLYNSAVGAHALTNNTSGNFNTSVGVNALYNNTTGLYNSSVGQAALQLNTTGHYNSAIGWASLFGNTTGSGNSAIGFQAGRFIADGLTALTVVNNSTYIGNNTKASADNRTNETVIGYNAVGTGDNTITLGGSAVTSTVIPYGNVGIGTSSPTSKLSIQGTTATDAPTLGAEFITGGTWTSTGWTGNNTTGWVNGASNATALSYSVAAVVSTRYQIAYTVTGYSAGSFTVAFGGQSLAGITATGAFGPTTTTTGNLVITPTSTFVGTIVFSIKSITAISAPVISLKDSTNTVMFETRVGSSLYNTFIGLSSGSYNTTGQQNTAVGLGALQNNTTGNANSAMGVNALYANTTGQQNIAVGGGALYANTTGQQNTAVGGTALYANTTGTLNNAFGYVSLSANTTGSSNNAFGRGSLQINTTGGNNNAFGRNALQANLTSSGSCAFGDLALTLSTGANNVAFGYGAGSAITSGANNVIIGGYTGVAAPISATGSNYIVLSDGAGTVRQVIDSSGNVGIGISTSIPSQLTVSGAGQLVAAISDAGVDTGTLQIHSTSAAAGAGGALLLSSASSVGGTTPQWGIKSLLSNGNTNGVGDLVFSGRTAVADTALTERIRILSLSASMGIGTSSPFSNSAYGSLTLNGSSGGVLSLKTADTETFRIQSQSTGTTINNITSIPMVFNTNNTEWLRITPTGGISFGSSGSAYGTAGQILISAANAPPTWTSSPNIGAATGTSLAVTGAITSSGAGIGYAAGAGVAVTQLTSRTTAAPTTSAKLCGAVTLFTTTAVVGTYFSFTVPNTAIAATDTIILNVRGASNTYIAFVSAITAATSFQVTMASVAGTASDAPIVNFSIHKAVSA
jgi:hypothetical protein